MKNSDIIEKVISLLRKVEKWEWRNTQALAKELKIDKNELLKALTEHSASENRQIRYHPLPSGRYLDILWGLVDKVGEAESLPALQRSDELDEQNVIQNFGQESSVFLSHNHKDFSSVLPIAVCLHKMELPCWLFEFNIEKYDLIIPAVEQAIKTCQYIVVFLSKQSLCSTWIRKEFGYSLTDNNKPVLVIVDGTDEKFVDFIYNLNLASNPTKELDGWIDKGRISVSGESRQQWKQNATEFYNNWIDYVNSRQAHFIYYKDHVKYKNKKMSLERVIHEIGWITEKK